jgi:hypothetical protein
MLLDEVFVEKERIALEIKEQLTKSMSIFGFMIIQVGKRQSSTDGSIVSYVCLGRRLHGCMHFTDVQDCTTSFCVLVI